MFLSSARNKKKAQKQPVRKIRRKDGKREQDTENKKEG